MRGVRAITAAAAALCTLALSAPGTAAPPCSSGTGPVDVRLGPRHGPVGTRVRLTGRCFARHWNAGYGIFLDREFTKPRECEVIAGGPFRFHVDRSRAGHGWFIVAPDGACFQHDYRRRVTPGVYQLSVGCHACAVARFRVTP
jgi:hypothetical protein